ncbi:MAG TPA: hypothetical protein VIQ29_10750 [Ancylobacter sp.]
MAGDRGISDIPNASPGLLSAARTKLTNDAKVPVDFRVLFQSRFGRLVPTVLEGEAVEEFEVSYRHEGDQP